MMLHPELRNTPPLKHSMDFLHLFVDHLRGEFLANERVGATKAIPEVIDLMRPLAD